MTQKASDSDHPKSKAKLHTEVDGDTDQANREVDLAGSFHYLMRVFHHIRRDAMAEAEFTIAQYQILTAFSHQPRWSIGELAEYLRVKPPAASELVDRMVKGNWIERTTNPANRRQSILTLTPLGQERLASRNAKMTEVYREILDVLSEKDQAKFLKAVRTLSDIARKLEQWSRR